MTKEEQKEIEEYIDKRFKSLFPENKKIKEPEWQIVEYEKKEGAVNFSYLYGHKIISVKRLSDGEIFSVGEITDGNNKINSFEMFGDNLRVHMQSVSNPIQGWLTNIQSLTKKQTKEPERIVVGNIMKLGYEGIYQFCTSYNIPQNKYPLIKQAIEQVLNNEQDNFRVLHQDEKITKEIYIDPQKMYYIKYPYNGGFSKTNVEGMEILQRLFGSYASMQAEKNAFNESRLTHPMLGFKYKNFEDYKKQNP